MQQSQITDQSMAPRGRDINEYTLDYTMQPFKITCIAINNLHH